MEAFREAIESAIDFLGDTLEKEKVAMRGYEHLSTIEALKKTIKGLERGLSLLHVNHEGVLCQENIRDIKEILMQIDGGDTE